MSRAEFRKSMLQTLFFDAAAGYFVDVDIATRAPTGKLSLAAAFPLFLEIAAPPQAERVVERLQNDFLATGGWLTTTRRTGQQWDRPNGWAPLQWVVFQGLSNYGRVAEAEVGARRWVTDNIAVYEATGRLLEKYDVERVRSLAAGGEYEVQDGFGWTNGVLLALMNRLGL